MYWCLSADIEAPFKIVCGLSLARTGAGGLFELAACIVYHGPGSTSVTTGGDLVWPKFHADSPIWVSIESGWFW